MKRNRWTAILFAVLLFGCGVLCGVLGQRYLSATVVNAKTAEDFRHRYVSEMKTSLKLTPDQVNRLEVILDETKAKYKAVRDESRPAMLKIKAEQIRRVKEILSPEQVPAYEKLIVERERKFREQEERDRQADLKQEAAHRAQAGH
jgi:hypothetical protein